MSATSLFILSDIATQVCNNLGASDNITQAKARQYINRAILRFIEMGTWSFQYVFEQPFPGQGSPINQTTPNQKAYTVLNALKITSLWMQSPIMRRLILLDNRKYRRMYPNDTAVGTPYYYRDMGRVKGSTSDQLQIGLYPVPDSNYVLLWDGIAAIPLLVNDTDDIRSVTGIPGYLVDLVIEMATAIGWKEIDDQDQGTQMAETVKRLAAAYADDQSELEDRLIMAPFESEDVDRYFDPQLDPRFGE